MLDKNQIIISHLKEGKSQRQISKEMGISRKTVKKYIASYLQQELPAAILHPPTYQVANRFKRKLVEEVQQVIDQCLEANEQKRHTGRHKQRMAAIDIYHKVLALGYKIGYTTVCNYIRRATHPSKEIFIKQHYPPGHTVEFDWGEVKLTIQGEEKRLMLAVFTAAYSNHRYARLFYRQDMASFLHSHVLFLEHTRCVPSEIVYDNMRVAVSRFSYLQKEKCATQDLLKLSAYYGFHYRFCNARKGNEKGHVERSVEYIRRKAFCQQDDFESLLQANEHLLQRCQQLNLASVKGKPQSIAACFEEEKQHMPPLPGHYDIGEYVSLRLDKFHCISIDTNHYSVPETLKGPVVTVKLYPDTIYLYEGSQLVAQHERRMSKYQWYIQLEHYLGQLRKKPGALNHSLALAQGDHWLRQLFERHFPNRAKDFIELLLVKKQTNCSEQDFKAAVHSCLATSSNSLIDAAMVRLLLDGATRPAGNITTCQDAFSQALEEGCARQLAQQQQLMNAFTNNIT